MLESILVFIESWLGIIIFGLFHSFFTEAHFKNSSKIPRYRLIYVILSSMLFLGIVSWQFSLVENHPELSYNLPFFIKIILRIIFVFGLIIAGIAMLQKRPLEFIGLKSRLVSNDEDPLSEGYIQCGAYAIARHPIYLGTLMLFIGGFLPAENWLVAWLALGYCIYTIVGAFHEEKHLKEIPGYHEYMKMRGMFFPWKIQHFKDLRLFFKFKNCKMNITRS